MGVRGNGGTCEVQADGYRLWEARGLGSVTAFPFVQL